MTGFFNRLFCRIFGHRWRCLYWRHWGEDVRAGSMNTGWYCDRCEARDHQQWDEA